jgi:hypothetical protein
VRVWIRLHVVDAVTPFEWFMWGVAAGTLAMHLLNRGYERVIEKRLDVAHQANAVLQRRLEREREISDTLHESTAARVELAFNFWAMQKAARDEEQA